MLRWGWWVVEPLRPGDSLQVGVYHLLGRLGAGGMGQVFLGASPGGRKVAVKLMLPEHAADQEFRERFRREVAAARQVGGFHTAHVVDADPDADPPWMVTAYISGLSLDATVREGGPLDSTAVRALGAALAEGLAAIHACGLVHRDLKPGNIIMAEDGPRIIDFGIARAADASILTSSGVVIGTFAFMSPEQVSGDPAGPESDIFSLGSVLAYAATGHGPFDARTIPAIIHRIVSQPGDLQAVSAPLRDIIGACLAKDPAGRPSLADLLALFSGVPAHPSEGRPSTVVSAPPRAAGPAVSQPDSQPPASPASGPELIPQQAGSPAESAPLTVTADGRQGTRSQQAAIRHAESSVASGVPERRARFRKGRVAMIVTALAAATATGLVISLVSHGSNGNQAGAGSTSAGRGSGSQSQTRPAIPASARGSSTTCVYTAAGTAARKVSLPSAKTDPRIAYTAVLRTSQGNITINLLNSRAPCTVNSFVHLAEAGYYDNTQCHRLLTTGIYVLQCGDPYATASTKLTCSSTSNIGTGTPGYEFASENLTGATYPAGTLAMANEGTADTNGSQFFVVYKDSTSGLTSSYTPFGAVSSGLDIVQKVAAAGYSCQYPQAGGGAPRDKVIIDSVTISKA
jgi:serine/threonine protein kinase/cyclophilin family peptidyl-prolyl cis-trans isomerase